MANVSGWITLGKFILGSTPTVMEDILGVRSGYFSHEMSALEIMRLGEG